MKGEELASDLLLQLKQTLVLFWKHVTLAVSKRSNLLNYLKQRSQWLVTIMKICIPTLTIMALWFTTYVLQDYIEHWGNASSNEISISRLPKDKVIAFQIYIKMYF